MTIQLEPGSPEIEALARGLEAFWRENHDPKDNFHAPPDAEAWRYFIPQATAACMVHFLRPDMFWDAGDGENGGGPDPMDILENYNPGEIIELQCAKQLTSMFAVYLWSEEDKGNVAHLFFSVEEAEAWLSDQPNNEGNK